MTLLQPSGRGVSSSSSSSSSSSWVSRVLGWQRIVLVVSVVLFLRTGPSSASSSLEASTPSTICSSPTRRYTTIPPTQKQPSSRCCRSSRNVTMRITRGGQSFTPYLQQQQSSSSSSPPFKVGPSPRLVVGRQSSSRTTPPRTKRTGTFGTMMNDDTDSKEYVESDVSTREAINAFLTRDSRNSFIARVYSILSVQLIITAISCFLFGLNPVLSNISQLSRNGEPSPWAAIPLVGIVASTLAWFRVCSSPEARRTSPQKWWWLALFTAGEALSVGFITSFYKFQLVVTAMGATAVATLAVSLYTIRQNNPNRDLSQMGASLSSASMILLTYLMIGMLQKSGIFPQGFLLLPFSDLLYSGFAACLFSAYLAHHTKLIVAGKHAKYRMNDQDYVFGAMALYTDVVGIFLNLLEILGSREQDRGRR